MDSFEEVMLNPLAFVQSEFEKTKKLSLSKTMEFFKCRLEEENNILKIPSLNDVASQYLPPNSLVRLRCMIQDMHDPEYSMGVYETINTKSAEKKLRLGLFKEISDCEPGEEILFDSSNAVTIERQNLYCVPVPGETAWVKEKYTEKSKFTIPSVCSEASGLKRQRSGDNDMETDPVETEGDKAMKLNIAASKRHRTITDSSVHSTSPTDDLGTSTGTFDLNFPLPGEEGTACLVTVYENQDQFRLNEIYEFIGILYVDPALAKQSLSLPKEDSETPLWPDSISAEEKAAHSPPASLVPRLHCVLARKIEYHSPSLPTTFNNGEKAPEDIPSTRAELMQILTRLLYGDELAAEYLLLNIISRVYGRADVLALGKFSLNLTNCKETKEKDHTLARDLYEFISGIVAKSYYFPLSIKDLNTTRVIPKKDYQSNRLQSGILQVAHGTHFILDETEMQPGQLDAQGVKNITAIGNMIQWQKVDYDFSFQQCEILTDIPVIVVSEGRSLFQCDCMLPLNKKDHSSPSANSLLSSMSKTLLEKIREYLAYVRHLNYALGADIQQLLQEDFTQSREQDSKSMDADIFQLLLVTARLYSLSYGKQELTSPFWNRVKAMDILRRERIAAPRPS